jgi:hypothetical protein
MLSRNDPRLRRALDQITRNIESANERTQENIFSFTQTYINPCLSSTNEFLRNSCTCCLSDEERRRRLRTQGRTGGRAELSFDFYDDWEQDESDALIGFAGDEHDPLLPTSSQPQRDRGMNYGTRQKASRKNLTSLEDDDDQKGNIIQQSSYFGFLERLPFRLGAKGLRYKPSIADLQDNPGLRKFGGLGGDTLLSDAEGAGASTSKRTHRRTRSNTEGSGNTLDSLSSRGDIFPSEDEMDDAVPLDDEFALHLHLERRTTGHTTDDTGSSSHKDMGNRSASRLSVLTNSSRGSHGSKKNRKGPTTEDIVNYTYPKAENNNAPDDAKDDKADSEDRVDSALPSAVATEYIASVPMSPAQPEMSTTSPPPGTLSQSSSLHENVTAPTINPHTNDNTGTPQTQEVSTEPSTIETNRQTSQPPTFNAAALPHFDSS